MSQMIHYRDDLFLVSMSVKLLEAAFSLDADPEFWKEKAFADILFVDATSRGIASLLAKNHHLVDRDDYLRLLERCSLDFSRSLERFLSADSALAQSLGDQRQRISCIIVAQKELAQDLSDNLSGDQLAEGGDASIVSGDELARLLGDGQS